MGSMTPWNLDLKGLYFIVRIKSPVANEIEKID